MTGRNVGMGLIALFVIDVLSHVVADYITEKRRETR
jgi:hypothetical protein